MRHTTFVMSDDFVKEICEHLGIDIKGLETLNIICKPGDIVRVETIHHPALITNWVIGAIGGTAVKCER